MVISLLAGAMIIKLMASPQICLCIYVNLTRCREPFSVLRMKEWQFSILGLSMFLFVFICTLFLWHTVIRWCHGLDWDLKFRKSLKGCRLDGELKLAGIGAHITCMRYNHIEFEQVQFALVSLHDPLPQSSICQGSY